MSRQPVDGVPCLLQDIDHASGGRLRTYLFLVPEAPKAQISFAIVCDDASACQRHQRDIDTVVESVRIARR
ncbi:MAG: hypothetical protein A3E25_20895 [Burkholderiales bacterium RIFCSPHIGHO2_12_FULL_69_20]|nr:MAG: hypothetical protein A3E25_20895 [Burkholderiales bacterium RIFCSPHIGHO2_12_FULL_69_20]